jgi:hypothetical protein
MDLTLLIGFIVIALSVTLVVVIFLIVKKLFGLKSSKEISIYVNEQKENTSSSKITNTPFVVDRKGKARISSDLVDDTVLTKVRRVRN